MAARKPLFLVSGTGQQAQSGDVVDTSTLGTGTANSTTYLRGDSTWQTIAGGFTFTVSASAPGSPAHGDEWIDSDTGAFYKYVNDGNTSQWVEIGGGGSGGSTYQYAHITNHSLFGGL